MWLYRKRGGVDWAWENSCGGAPRTSRFEERKQTQIQLKIAMEKADPSDSSRTAPTATSDFAAIDSITENEKCCVHYTVQ